MSISLCQYSKLNLHETKPRIKIYYARNVYQIIVIIWSTILLFKTKTDETIKKNQDNVFIYSKFIHHVGISLFSFPVWINLKKNNYFQIKSSTLYFNKCTFPLTISVRRANSQFDPNSKINLTTNTISLSWNVLIICFKLLNNHDTVYTFRKSEIEMVPKEPLFGRSLLNKRYGCYCVDVPYVPCRLGMIKFYLTLISVDNQNFRSRLFQKIYLAVLFLIFTYGNSTCTILLFIPGKKIISDVIGFCDVSLLYLIWMFFFFFVFVLFVFCFVFVFVFVFFIWGVFLLFFV